MRILFFNDDNSFACSLQQRDLGIYNTLYPIQALDTVNDRELFDEYGIRDIPTLILLDGNVEVKRTTFLLGNDLLNWLTNND